MRNSHRRSIQVAGNTTWAYAPHSDALMTAVPAAADTRMFREAAEAPQRVREQLSADAGEIEALGERLRRLRPRALITCARGSSDHAATFARYLVETRMGVLTASSPPSI